MLVRFRFPALLLAGALLWPLTPTLGAGVPEQRVLGLFPGASDPRAPGCAVSIMRAGRVELERAWGLADLASSTPNTLGSVFEAGSVSKQFTAAAIAVLAAQGRLRLDDDVRRYLPEMRTHERPITLRMLLTHTSGVRNWDDLVELAGRAREDASGLTQTDALAIILRQQELNFPPGDEYLYSNSNYVLAAVIVERVSGMSFSAFSKKELFDPAGMSDTQWRDDYRRQVPRRANAYSPDDSGVLRLDMPEESVVGPGGLLTTVGDLQKWNAFLERPGQAQAWVSILTQTHGALADGTRIHYGLGLEYDQLQGHDIVSHAGATAGYRGYLARVPDQKLSVAILCNAGAVNTEDAGPELVSLFLPGGPRAVDAVTPAGTAPRDIAGHYQNKRTRSLVTATVDAAGVRFNGGAAFHDVSQDRLANADATRSLLVERNANGTIRLLRLSRVGNAPAILIPVPAWKPSLAELVGCQGSFYSADIGASWRITLDNGALRATGPRGETFALDPIYPDAFAGRDAYWTLVFERNERSSIEGVRFYKPRTLGVSFRRASM